MTAITVKVVKDNGEEIGSQRFPSGVTAGEVKASLIDINGKWRGKLEQPGSDLNLTGSALLIPGSTYYLHASEFAGDQELYRTILGAQRAQPKTVKLSVSKAPQKFRSVVQEASGLTVVPLLGPVAGAAKIDQIKARFSAAGGPAGITMFQWEGDEDNAAEVQRAMDRIQTLAGGDDFPTTLQQHDIRNQMLFDVRIDDVRIYDNPSYRIVGKADIAVLRAGVMPDASILKETLVLIELETDLSTTPLQNKADTQAYLQYLALQRSTNRHVPLLLTDGNNLFLYLHNPHADMHQRLCWTSDKILHAAVYLQEFFVELAAANPVYPVYVPRQLAIT